MPSENSSQPNKPSLKSYAQLLSVSKELLSASIAGNTEQISVLMEKRQALINQVSSISIEKLPAEAIQKIQLVLQEIQNLDPLIEENCMNLKNKLEGQLNGLNSSKNALNKYQMKLDSSQSFRNDNA
ncbi:MAG: flagellar protein FliT [Cyanobacteria bacterium]|nr:flagellar protein FliT [Cyanobacteriota bacterium]